MTHIYTQKIDKLVQSNKIYRFNNELENTDNSERKQKIKCILQKYQEYISPVEIKENKIKNHIDILRISQYNKRWQDLTNKQKINRIEKYIEDNKINIELQDIDRLKEYIDKKLLLTKHIKYDRNTGIIANITIINKKDNTYVLEHIEKVKIAVVKNKKKDSKN